MTRGNGEVGEVITNNARTFQNLPVSIAYQGELVLRGEAVITYSDFEKSMQKLWKRKTSIKIPEICAAVPCGS